MKRFLLAFLLISSTAHATGDHATLVDRNGNELGTASNPIKISLSGGTVQSKSVTVPNPTATEDITLFYADDAITISKIVYVITGSTSTTVTVRHHTDRNNTGNEVVTGGTTANSTTTGNVVTSFNDATVPADSFVWLETTALSGTPTSLSATIFFTKDA